MLIKICTRCRVKKSIESFSKASREADGLQDRCKQCNKETSSAYRAANSEKERLRNRLYQQANKAKCAARSASYRKRHADKVRAAAREFYEAHKQSENQRASEYHRANATRIRESKKKWKSDNQAACRTHESKRRAFKLCATVQWANEEKIAAHYAKSAKLTRETGIVHHVDHIVPLISDIVCGLHWEGNLQVLPALKNWEKRNLHWPDMP